MVDKTANDYANYLRQIDFAKEVLITDIYN